MGSKIMNLFSCHLYPLFCPDSPDTLKQHQEKEQKRKYQPVKVLTSTSIMI